jgi:hypothetical protein
MQDASAAEEDQHHHHRLQQHQPQHQHDGRLTREHEALAEAYGDRSSLEELQRAIEIYEAQRGRR